MNATEIVIREVQRNRGFQVRQFLAEGVGEPRKTAHRHSHMQILAIAATQCLRQYRNSAEPSVQNLYHRGHRVTQRNRPRRGHAVCRFLVSIYLRGTALMVL
jgi:hypothetical protein